MKEVSVYHKKGKLEPEIFTKSRPLHSTVIEEITAYYCEVPAA
jgi:hypothetical protein